MLKHITLPFIDPMLIFNLVAHEYGTIFFDSSEKHQSLGRYSFIAINPLIIFDSYSTQFYKFIIELEYLINKYRVNTPQMPPFIGGVAGYFAYDLGKEFENIKCNSNIFLDIPTYKFGLYNQVIAFDHLKNLCHLIVFSIPNISKNDNDKLDNLKSLYDKAKQNTLEQVLSTMKLPFIHINSNFTKYEYLDIVNKAIDYILSGYVYEVNLSQCFTGEIPVNYSIINLYKKLHIINKATFAAFMNFDNLKILSCSPERLISIRGNYIEARPIKGTIKRSNDNKVDLQLAQSLKDSAKERAENIMIVDLLRNDLSKICIANSVNVTQLCAIESLPNIHHLVSVICGELKSNILLSDVITAVFPGGSITGAPKIMSMNIIEELEKCLRGIYCGSIGYFSFSGNVDLSIAIRTITINNNKLTFNVGGAITLNSNPISEYEETLLKGQKIIEAINGTRN